MFWQTFVLVRLFVIIDYEMKLELGLRTRENQREWYGKRIYLHDFLVIAQVGSFWIVFTNSTLPVIALKVEFGFRFGTTGWPVR